jgi:hypothetical protein
MGNGSSGRGSIGAGWATALGQEQQQQQSAQDANAAHLPTQQPGDLVAAVKGCEARTMLQLQQPSRQQQRVVSPCQSITAQHGAAKLRQPIHDSHKTNVTLSLSRQQLVRRFCTV